MNQIFDINRSIALLKLNFFQNKKTFLLTIAGFFGFVFVTSFFIAKTNPAFLNPTHVTFYFILLYGGVAFIAGNSYRNLSTHEKSIASLSVPASTFEKYLIPWLVSGLIWAAFAILSYIGIANLINALWSGVFGFPFHAFNPLQIPMMQHSLQDTYLPYFFIHATFFLGAAAFRKHAIPKTLLAGFVVNSILTFFSLFLVIILFGGFGDFGEAIASVYQNESYGYVFTATLPNLIKYGVIYALPVIFYITTYFKLREREV